MERLSITSWFLVHFLMTNLAGQSVFMQINSTDRRILYLDSSADGYTIESNTDTIYLVRLSQTHSYAAISYDMQRTYRAIFEDSVTVTLATGKRLITLSRYLPISRGWKNLGWWQKNQKPPSYAPDWGPIELSERSEHMVVFCFSDPERRHIGNPPMELAWQLVSQELEMRWPEWKPDKVVVSSKDTDFVLVFQNKWTEDSSEPSSQNGLIVYRDGGWIKSAQWLHNASELLTPEERLATLKSIMASGMLPEGGYHLMSTYVQGLAD